MQFGDEGDDMSDGTGSQPLTDEDEDEEMGEGEGDWVSDGLAELIADRRRGRARINGWRSAGVRRRGCPGR